MVYRIALLQMKNRSEAEDVFQEVFLRLVKYHSRIEGQEHLKAWLIRVTINCCRKQFDNAYRRKTVPFLKKRKLQSPFMRWKRKNTVCMKQYRIYRQIIEKRGAFVLL